MTTPRKIPAPVERHCPDCGKTFDAFSSNARRCPACRVAEHNRITRNSNARISALRKLKKEQAEAAAPQSPAHPYVQPCAKCQWENECNRLLWTLRPLLCCPESPMYHVVMASSQSRPQTITLSQ